MIAHLKTLSEAKKQQNIISQTSAVHPKASDVVNKGTFGLI